LKKWIIKIINGNLTDIIDYFIEIKVDGLDLSQQSSVYSIKKFGQKFGGKLGLHVYFDLQTTGISGSREKLTEEAYDIVQHWSTDEASNIVTLDYLDIESIGGYIERKKSPWLLLKRRFIKRN